MEKNKWEAHSMKSIILSIIEAFKIFWKNQKKKREKTDKSFKMLFYLASMCALKKAQLSIRISKKWRDGSNNGHKWSSIVQ